jgi:metal-responsive CopG/Arc/MetJ family transcriptional regulator
MSKLLSQKTRATGISATMPESIVKEMDQVRGFVPRSTWIRQAVIEKLQRQKKKPTAAVQQEDNNFIE